MVHPDVKLDLQRGERVGLDEAIFAEGKSLAQLRSIIEQAVENGMRRLFTRLTEARYAQLSDAHRSALDYDVVSGTAILGETRRACDVARVAIVAAGSSDVPVSREALRTLEFHGHPCCHIADVGVAGLWRLTERLDEIRDKDVVIVAAGMDGALPSVVAGLVPGLVIALPTSVGYGVADGGRTALNAALASCAPGLVVVNIDNGYGAACAAIRALNLRSPRR